MRDVPRAKRSKYIPVVLSREEIDIALSHLEYPFDTAVGLLYGSGLRLFECLGLRVQNFNFDDGILTVHGKGDKDRTIPLPEGIGDVPRIYGFLNNPYIRGMSPMAHIFKMHWCNSPMASSNRFNWPRAKAVFSRMRTPGHGSAAPAACRPPGGRRQQYAPISFPGSALRSLPGSVSDISRQHLFSAGSGCRQSKIHPQTNLCPAFFHPPNRLPFHRAVSI